MATEEKPENHAGQPDEPDRRQFIKGASCAIGAAIGAVPMVAGVRVALNPLGEKNSGGEAEFIQLAQLADLKTGVPKKFSIVADKTDKWTRYRDVPVGAVYLLKTVNEGKLSVTAAGEVKVMDTQGREHSVLIENSGGRGVARFTETQRPGLYTMTSPNKTVVHFVVNTGRAESNLEQLTAFNTVCPHLGCFVDYRTEKQDFFCPCHDSNFALDGKLKKGVSPRDMDSLKVEIRNDAEVWVKYQRFKANSSKKVVIS